MLATVVSPVGKAMAYLAKITLKSLGLKSAATDLVSESELRLIVTGALSSGSIEAAESSMIAGVLNLQESRVRSIMKTPRVGIVALPAASTVAEALEVIKDSGYSRIPVYDGDIDNIVGTVLAKDLIDLLSRSIQQSPGPAPDLSGVLSRPIAASGVLVTPFFVPESMTVANVLQEMRRRRVHLGVVVDEHGGTEGLVTLEDILEQVVGEIYDEDDTKEVEEEGRSIVKRKDGRFAVRADADLEDVAAALGLDVDERALRTFETLNGFLVDVVGSIPKTGTFVPYGEWTFEITEVDKKRILGVLCSNVGGGKAAGTTTTTAAVAAGATTAVEARKGAARTTEGGTGGAGTLKHSSKSAAEKLENNH